MHGTRTAQTEHSWAESCVLAQFESTQQNLLSQVSQGERLHGARTPGSRRIW